VRPTTAASPWRNTRQIQGAAVSGSACWRRSVVGAAPWIRPPRRLVGCSDSKSGLVARLLYPGASSSRGFVAVEHERRRTQFEFVLNSPNFGTRPECCPYAGHAPSPSRGSTQHRRLMSAPGAAEKTHVVYALCRIFTPVLPSSYPNDHTHARTPCSRSAGTSRTRATAPRRPPSSSRPWKLRRRCGKTRYPGR